MKLGVNIDHIATLRNARGEGDPSLLECLFEVQEGGADSITMHLREDRRHILDEDVLQVKQHGKLPINFEMALTDDMIKFSLDLQPRSVCIVPEKREEVTTEGGLNISQNYSKIKEILPEYNKRNIEVFLFVDSNDKSIKESIELDVDGIEVHTGTYANLFKTGTLWQKPLADIKAAAELCKKNNMKFHAGHGLNYWNIYNLLDIENLKEVNIGHSIISYSFKTGLCRAVKKMKEIII